MLLTVLAFVGAATLIVLLPGPDTLVVVRSILRGGRRQGTLTALGNLCGLTAWVTGAALGLAAMLEASEIGYAALRIVGACYLVFLGVQAWRSRGRVEDAGGDTRRGVLGTGFRAGLLTNLFNPKIALFYTTFLPQFIRPGDPVLLWSLGMAAVHVALGVVWLSAYAWLLNRAVDAFRGSRLRRALDALTGTVLVALGIRVAAD